MRAWIKKYDLYLIMAFVIAIGYSPILLAYIFVEDRVDRPLRFDETFQIQLLANAQASDDELNVIIAAARKFIATKEAELVSLNSKHQNAYKIAKLEELRKCGQGDDAYRYRSDCKNKESRAVVSRLLGKQHEPRMPTKDLIKRSDFVPTEEELIKQGILGKCSGVRTVMNAIDAGCLYILKCPDFFDIEGQSEARYYRCDQS